MSKLSILLADTDEKYLIPLELKLIEGFQNEADLTVITEPGFLKEYFSVPRHIDVFIINEELYAKEFEKHDIVNTFLLTEQDEGGETGSIAVTKIYKYTSVKEIYAEIVNNIKSKDPDAVNKRNQTRVVTIYSPIGGIGKTTLSMGISAVLSQKYRKVLYINTDCLQTFQFLLSDEEYVETGFERHLSTQNGHIMDYFNLCVKNEMFDYLPPFHQTLSSLDIQMDDFLYLVEAVKSAKKYDDIILDTSSDFTADKAKLMSCSDSVILVAGQSRTDTLKLERLLSNIDSSDHEKFIFICNRYQQEKENYLIKENMIHQCHINEYVRLLDDLDHVTLKQLSGFSDLQKCSLLLN